jgi:hypothetical protein
MERFEESAGCPAIALSIQRRTKLRAPWQQSYPKFNGPFEREAFKKIDIAKTAARAEKMFPGAARDRMLAPAGRRSANLMVSN